MVLLVENYRSTAVILDAANVLIKGNARRIPKELRARRADGEPIRIVSLPDQRTEAETIVREIEDRVGGTSHYRLAGEKAARDFKETSYAFSDFAVLFRTNAQAKVLREAFEEWGIPCQVVGERHPLNKKGLIEKLRARIMDSPLGLTPVARPDVFSLLRDAAGEAGVPAADASLLEALAAPYQHLPPHDAVIEIINELTLLTTADAFDPRADAVALMTLHMAKGLEFKVVFIAGCDEGLMPFALAKDDADIEEERRLFYVGMTRAKDELLLFHAKDRFVYGRRLSGNPSPFLGEIPLTFVRTERAPDRPVKRKKAKQPTLF
jgi:superfamily I DNA/RNA helicase